MKTSEQSETYYTSHREGDSAVVSVLSVRNVHRVRTNDGIYERHVFTGPTVPTETGTPYKRLGDPVCGRL